jgi:SAM-dependent methyltransferase
MDDDPYRLRYVEHLRFLQANFPHRRAMELAVGGEFHALGVLERELLKHCGLRPDDFLIDVGCGSGRLAKALRGYLQPDRYLGTDVLPELLDHARMMVGRPDWRFELSDGVAIPQEAGTANMVCFFSVLTHLPLERCYAYLQEARRVLRPDGKIIFSFLEFPVAGHWQIFEAMVNASGSATPWVQFIGRDAIDAWASHLGLRIDFIAGGDQAVIPLPEPLITEDGARYEGAAALGQSICALVPD